MSLVRLDQRDAAIEFPGCTATAEVLRALWRVPAGGWSRKHLVAETTTGRIVMWDDRVRAWCTVWGESTRGGFVQYSSRAWLDERLAGQAEANAS